MILIVAFWSEGQHKLSSLANAKAVFFPLEEFPLKMNHYAFPGDGQ